MSVVLSQFTTLTSVISGHYTVLLATLCQENAVVWTQCHEVLSACCNILTNCYSPQLLISVGLIFAYFITNSYVLIMSVYLHNQILSLLFFMFYLFFHVCVVWYIIFCCNNIVQKVSNFLYIFIDYIKYLLFFFFFTKRLFKTL